MKTIDFGSYNEALKEQLWDLAAETIAEQGFIVFDNFLTSEKAAYFRNRIDIKNAEDEFKKAGIGKDLDYQKDMSIRGDLIHWIEKDDVPEKANTFIEEMTLAMSELNTRLFLGLKDFETHYTLYPTGTYYKRHSDRFAAKAHRVLSFVCYLNKGWLLEDGGQLLVYNNDDQMIIDPIEGRLIIFQSQLEHEVLPTFKERYSITGWMLDQIEGLTFL